MEHVYKLTCVRHRWLFLGTKPLLQEHAATPDISSQEVGSVRLSLMPLLPSYRMYPDRSPDHWAEMWHFCKTSGNSQVAVSPHAVCIYLKIYIYIYSFICLFIYSFIYLFMYLPGPSKGYQLVPKGCQFTIPLGFKRGTPSKMLASVYTVKLIDCMKDLIQKSVDTKI